MIKSKGKRAYLVIYKGKVVGVVGVAVVKHARKKNVGSSRGKKYSQFYNKEEEATKRMVEEYIKSQVPLKSPKPKK